MADPMPPHAIAIIGLAGRFPGAEDLDQFWRNIANGVECLEEPTDADLDAAGVPPEIRSHPNFVRRCTALDGAGNFDAGFFGVSPRDAQIVDPQHRIFLECAWEALENAGYAPGASDHAVSVYAGASMNTYLFQLVRDPDLVESVGRYQLMVGNDKDFLCTWVSYKLNLKGPSVTVQTACSTSLVAVAMACQALARGECDVALAGGVSVMAPERSGYLYEEGMIFSPDGHCRPFDVGANGTRGGAGAGIVVLKRLSDALAEGDTIHAVIRGAAINNDGADKAGFTAPSVDGQMEAIATAQALAGIRPREISYIETHGTGTPLGDPIEIAALAGAFQASTKDVGFCRLGSLKANLGHLDAAAGVAGLIKTVLALKNQRIPPLVNFTSPNPKLDLPRTPFVASAEGAPWTSDGAPRRAGVSSFGIGGTNAHVVLEEAPAAPTRLAAGPRQVLVVSAKTAAVLERAAARLADDLDRRPDRRLEDIAWTLQAGRHAFAHRRAVVAETCADAAARLRNPQAASAVHEGGPRPVAFLFSGQGSQRSGMGQALFEKEAAYRDAVDRCVETLSDEIGCDIRDVLFGEKGNQINETRFAQPALFVTEYALACLWRHWGVVPKAMIGHSAGEYVAAHLAGVMSLDDALRIVATRGRLMQACPPGAMAAVNLSQAEIAVMLPAGLEIAAVNGPDLCAVSGDADAISAWVNRLAAKGVQCSVLKTSHAYHSASMEPAMAGLVTGLGKIPLSAPTVPYVSNVTGAWITPQEATSPPYYAEQMRRPVQFLSSVRVLLADRSLVLLEVGPGASLQTMARLAADQSRSSQIVASLPGAAEPRPDDEAMLEAAGRLWLSGVPLNWRGFHDGAAPVRVPLPTYPFERERHWIDPRPQSAASSARLACKENIGDWLFAPTWRRDESIARKRPALSGSWIVMGRRGALAMALSDGLAKAGAEPIPVEIGDTFSVEEEKPFRVRHDEPDDLAAVTRRLQERRRPVRGAIYIWSRSDDWTKGEADYRALVALSESLRLTEEGGKASLIVATFGAQSVVGEPVRNVGASLALGPVLTLPAETPGLSSRLVDFDAECAEEAPAATVEALIEETGKGGAESIVARRGGRRWLRRYDRLALPAASLDDLPVKSGGVYLITGGLGGIGLAMANQLARWRRVRLLLTGRTALPERAGWDRALVEQVPDSAVHRAITGVRGLEALGAEVIAAQADVADKEQMEAAIALARSRWGDIDGVIHAAGIAGNGRLAVLKSKADVRSVLSPKVNGLAVIARSLGVQSLDFVALMSSINAVVGAPGLCDYTAANAVLDAFVESDERPALWRNVIAFDWGPWRDVGMAANLAAAAPQGRQQEILKLGIATPVGIEVFARALAAGPSRIVVTPYDLVEAADRGRTETVVAGQGPGAPDTASPRAAQAASQPVIGPATEVALAGIWSELLGVSDVGPDANFFELGGHSLLATRMMARIHESLGARVSLRAIFDAPTVRKLAAYIDAAQSPSDREKVADEEEREEFVF